jgi:hypothetical protein
MHQAYYSELVEKAGSGSLQVRKVNSYLNLLPLALNAVHPKHGRQKSDQLTK